VHSTHPCLTRTAYAAAILDVHGPGHRIALPLSLIRDSLYTGHPEADASSVRWFPVTPRCLPINSTPLSSRPPPAAPVRRSANEYRWRTPPLAVFSAPHPSDYRGVCAQTSVVPAAVNIRSGGSTTACWSRLPSLTSANGSVLQSIPFHAEGRWFDRQPSGQGQRNRGVGVIRLGGSPRVGVAERRLALNYLMRNG
jgi:hypothetical protein